MIKISIYSRKGFEFISPALNLIYRKSSKKNIEKFRKEINRYFYIKKHLHYNGNVCFRIIFVLKKSMNTYLYIRNLEPLNFNSIYQYTITIWTCVCGLRKSCYCVNKSRYLKDSDHSYVEYNFENLLWTADFDSKVGKCLILYLWLRLS